jgi:hypothetical protein
MQSRLSGYFPLILDIKKGQPNGLPFFEYDLNYYFLINLL